MIHWEQIISRETCLKQQDSGPETNYNISVMALSRRQTMYGIGARFIHETRPETDTSTTWLRQGLSVSGASGVVGRGCPQAWRSHRTLDRARQTCWCPQAPARNWQITFLKMTCRGIELALDYMRQDGKEWGNSSSKRQWTEQDWLPAKGPCCTKAMKRLSLFALCWKVAAKWLK